GPFATMILLISFFFISAILKSLFIYSITVAECVFFTVVLISAKVKPSRFKATDSGRFDVSIRRDNILKRLQYRIVFLTVRFKSEQPAILSSILNRYRQIFIRQKFCNKIWPLNDGNIMLIEVFIKPQILITVFQTVTVHMVNNEISGIIRFDDVESRRTHTAPDTQSTPYKLCESRFASPKITRKKYHRTTRYEVCQFFSKLFSLFNIVNIYFQFHQKPSCSITLIYPIIQKKRPFKVSMRLIASILNMYCPAASYSCGTSVQLPSALESLTAVFGMGTGVASPPSQPDHV